MIEMQWDAMFDIPFKVIPITSFDTILPCPKKNILAFYQQNGIAFLSNSRIRLLLFR